MILRYTSDSDKIILAVERLCLTMLNLHLKRAPVVDNGCYNNLVSFLYGGNVCFVLNDDTSCRHKLVQATITTSCSIQIQRHFLFDFCVDPCTFPRPFPFSTVGATHCSNFFGLRKEFIHDVL